MSFFEPFLKEFDPKDLKISFSFEFFKKHENIVKNSVSSWVQMRKIFDAYFSSVYTAQSYEEKYQRYNLRRARNLDREWDGKVYKWFTEFMHTIFIGLWENFALFKDFLEMYLIYHKYFLNSQSLQNASSTYQGQNRNTTYTQKPYQTSSQQTNRPSR